MSLFGIDVVPPRVFVVVLSVSAYIGMVYSLGSVVDVGTQIAIKGTIHAERC